MPIIQQGNNPTRYVSDYSAFGKIGGVLSNMVAKYPQLKALDQKAMDQEGYKENASTAFNSIYDAILTDEPSRNAYAKSKGIDPADTASITQSIDADKQNAVAKESETPGEHTMRVTQSLSPIVNAEGMDSGVLGQIATSLATTQGGSGQDLSKSVRNTVATKAYGDKYKTWLADTESGKHENWNEAIGEAKQWMKPEHMSQITDLKGVKEKMEYKRASDKINDFADKYFSGQNIKIGNKTINKNNADLGQAFQILLGDADVFYNEKTRAQGKGMWDAIVAERKLSLDKSRIEAQKTKTEGQVTSKTKHDILSAMRDVETNWANQKKIWSGRVAAAVKDANDNAANAYRSTEKIMGDFIKQLSTLISKAGTSADPQKIFDEYLTLLDQYEEADRLNTAKIGQPGDKWWGRERKPEATLKAVQKNLASIGETDINLTEDNKYITRGSGAEADTLYSLNSDEGKTSIYMPEPEVDRASLEVSDTVIDDGYGLPADAHEVHVNWVKDNYTKQLGRKPTRKELYEKYMELKKEGKFK